MDGLGECSCQAPKYYLYFTSQKFFSGMPPMATGTAGAEFVNPTDPMSVSHYLTMTDMIIAHLKLDDGNGGFNIYDWVATATSSYNRWTGESSITATNNMPEGIYEGWPDMPWTLDSSVTVLDNGLSYHRLDTWVISGTEMVYTEHVYRTLSDEYSAASFKDDCKALYAALTIEDLYAYFTAHPPIDEDYLHGIRTATYDSSGQTVWNNPTFHEETIPVYCDPPGCTRGLAEYSYRNYIGGGTLSVTLNQGQFPSSLSGYDIFEDESTPTYYGLKMICPITVGSGYGLVIGLDYKHLNQDYSFAATPTTTGCTPVTVAGNYIALDRTVSHNPVPGHESIEDGTC